MDRRSFLTGISTLALSQILGGCGGGNKETLKVHFLKNSLPAQLVHRCRQELGQSFKLDVKPESQIADLFAQLQALNISPTPNGHRPAFGQPSWLANLLRRDQPGSTQQNLFSLGNYWLATAIQQNLIQPLQPTQLANWNQLPPRWQELVTRDHQGNLASPGQVWGAPYRWGTTMIAYRQDQFERLGWTPTDWSDLWRPALSRRVSLPDQAREVIGLTLKKLGESYNSENIKALPRLEPELQSLHQQVKLYSSDAYLQPLILGDTWLAVGWSTDILPLVRRDRQIQAVIPRSGTAVWADLWIHPKAGTSELINPWIDFWWQPEIATQLSQLSNGGSPLLTGSSLDQALFLPDQQVFARSEFIGPLPDAAVEQYRSLWLKIRRAAQEGAK